MNQTKQYIDAEFIRFICISTTQPTFNDVVSREFYAFPKLDSKGLNKTKKWQASESPSPPNVVILGVDTMSRLGSQRVLPQSIGLLKRLGAVELKGYMKGYIKHNMSKIPGILNSNHCYKILILFLQLVKPHFQT